jgi:hypothetical protein
VKTPERRAKKVTGMLSQSRKEGRQLSLRTLIASEIREAENATLEQAATIADEALSPSIGDKIRAFRA